MEKLLIDLKVKLSTYWSDFAEWWRDTSIVLAPDDYDPVLDVGGFLTILAFSLAVFTLERPKYRIRQEIALIPIKSVLFRTLVVFGAFIFFTEAAIQLQLPLPWPLEPNTINLILAGWVAMLAIYWMLICFLRPPRYGLWTARRYYEESFRGVVNGTEEEMLALARELNRELDRIIKNCPIVEQRSTNESQRSKFTKLEAYTYQMLSLLEDPRFCDAVAREMPSFPARLVERLVNLKRFDTPAPIIIRRMVIAMLSNKRSAVFVENEMHSRGIVGQTKPITSLIFRNWSKFECSRYRMSSPLDLNYPYAQDWDVDGWRVYFGMARQYLMGVSDVQGSLADRSGINDILRTMEVAYGECGANIEQYKYSDPRNPRRHVRECNNFLCDLIKVADERDEWAYFDRKDENFYGTDLSSHLAKLLENALMHISGIQTDDFFSLWDRQHNDYWYRLREHNLRDSPTMRMVRRKLRRMIWVEVKRMDDFRNYRSARLVRFCLFVLGFYTEDHKKDSVDRESWPLAKVVSNWVRRNYQDIAITHPPIAEKMLPIGFRYDAENSLLVRERGDMFTGKARTFEFKLDPPKKGENVQQGDAT